MKSLRGFALPELALILGIVLGITALSFAVHSWLKDYNEGLREEGRAEVRQAYQKRDNAQLKVVQTELEKLRSEKEEQEKRHLAAVNALEMDHAKKKAQRDAEYDAFLADLAAGRVVFRHPGESRPGPACGNQSGPGTATADSGSGTGHVGGGAVPAESEDALFLVSEARRADKIIDKLNLCRGTLKSERS